MHVSIITPESTLLSAEATQVLVPGEKAPFAMRTRHQAIISQLVSDGIVKITEVNGEVLKVAIEGSCIVEQHEDEVTILADKAELL